MYGCKNCLDNRWSFEYGEGIVVATCQGCGSEVMFPAKRKNVAPARTPAKVKITKEGQPCRKCGTPVIHQSHHKPPKDKHGGYYFEWWFKCPGCCTLYMVEEAKRFFTTPAVSIAAASAAFPDPNFVDDGRAPWL